MAALWAGNHEVVIADHPSLLGALRLQLALVVAEKARRTTSRANADSVSGIR